MALCVLMGLGIVTGVIAIARMATTYQISSSDLPWASIPNSMTRIFEVNMGNTAACVPILKPFTRYVHAKVTGRDPHQILRRKDSDCEFHTRSYKRVWRLQGRGAGGRGHLAAQYRTDLPPRGRNAGSGSTKEHSTTAGSLRTASIVLPMQGTRGAHDASGTPDMTGIPDAHYFRLTSPIPRTDFRSFYEVKDIV